MADREVAAGWCERAAEAANRSTAWEEAATLYEYHAAELTGSDAAPEARYRRLLGSAKARLHCDEMTAAVQRSMEAAEASAGSGVPTYSPRPVSSPKAGPGHPSCWGSCTILAEEALATLDPDDHALRARLLGQLAVTAFYVDPAATEPLSREALAEADVADDPLASVAAVRARQMCLIEPQHAAERLALAARMGATGRVLNRPTVTQWESIWRVDALLELGRVGEARHELVELRRRVATVGLPISKWHLARVEALLADTAGRFDEAITWSERAHDLLRDARRRARRHPPHLPVRGTASCGGYDADTVCRVVDFEYDEAPAFLGDLPALAPIQALAGIGDIEPPRSLRPPRPRHRAGSRHRSFGSP